MDAEAQPKIHNLKTWPAPYSSLVDGTKTFEIRKDDRGYRVGDMLVLMEWIPPEEIYQDGEGCYTGRVMMRRVTYKTDWEQKDGHVVLGISEVL